MRALEKCGRISHPEKTEESCGGFFRCMKGNVAQINWCYDAHALSDEVDA